MENAGRSELRKASTHDALDLEDGRDELNLAEFPLAAISDRIPDNQKTLVFEDQIFDAGKAKTITRRLTISAADKFGLPTSLDDEVILGLIQLTKQNRFAERKVNFSRYQLIQILGWRLEGRSYERLEKSLKRWLGVTLDYEKAWWDKDAQSWVDESFHILDNVTLYDQERRLKKLRSSTGEPALSSFSWNEVVFRSFKSGYLKAIDLGVFRQLQYAAAKRMYRFLDKRFYHKSRWEFDLAEFSFEHIGLSRSYDTGQLKRRLQPAIAELESVGFIQPLAPQKRYVKIARGEWRIVFICKSVPQIDEPSSEASLLADRLKECGVTPSVVAELVRDYPHELIKMQIEVVDRLRQNKKRESIRNPAGYLVKSIREGYMPPASFAPKKMKQRPSSVSTSHRLPCRDPQQEQIDSSLKTLSLQDLQRLEEAAIKRVPLTLADGYRRSKQAGGAAFAIYQRMVLEFGIRHKLLEVASLQEKQVV